MTKINIIKSINKIFEIILWPLSKLQELTISTKNRLATRAVDKKQNKELK